MPEQRQAGAAQRRVIRLTHGRRMSNKSCAETCAVGVIFKGHCMRVRKALNPAERTRSHMKTQKRSLK